VLRHPDRIGIGWVIGGFVGWLLGSIIALGFLLSAYRERWAPLRHAVAHDD
jgi:glycine cleavage system aminomethyltransferase T